MPDREFRQLHGLSEVADEAARRPGLDRYAEYCRLRDKGMRKEAFDSLGQFIKKARDWPLEDRTTFADWILEVEDHIPDLDQDEVIPKDLQSSLLNPTIKEWALAEPENPAPWRWMDTQKSLKRAVRLSEQETIARRRLARAYLDRTEFNSRDLPQQYHGDPHADYKRLVDARELLEELDNFDIRPSDASLKTRILRLTHALGTYLRYLESGSDLDFWDWLEEYSEQRDH